MEHVLKPLLNRGQLYYIVGPHFGVCHVCTLFSYKDLFISADSSVPPPPPHPCPNFNPMSTENIIQLFCPVFLAAAESAEAVEHSLLSFWRLKSPIIGLQSVK